MKSFIVSVSIVLASIVVAIGCGGKDVPAGGTTLTVYCYDSFSSEWGPGPAIVEEFEAETGATVTLVAPGDAVTVLNRLILEKEDPVADVVVGLDDGMAARAFARGILTSYEPRALDSIPEDLRFDPDYRLVPYDYGHFAVVYDAWTVEKPPTSLEDLTDPRFAVSLVLMDPRTSSPGLGFLRWTVAVYGDAWPAYWERLAPNILTIADGWSQGYALFTAGEAPMVLSYGTSPVYHVAYEETDRYVAAGFTDGHVRQIEAMGVVAGTENRKLAEKFIEHMLSPSSQLTIATANIMFPARRDVDLPDAFSSALRPATLPLRTGTEAADIDAILDRWTELVGR